MNEITILHATLADLDAVARVHCDAWLHAYRGILDDAFNATLTPEVFASYHKPRLTPPLDPANFFLVAVDDHNRVLGFTRGGLTRDKTPTGDPLPESFMIVAPCELFAIYIRPELVGKGVGWHLLRASAATMASNGHRKMCVWVLRDNHLARRFYERTGAVLLPHEADITLGGKKYSQVSYVWHSLDALAGLAGGGEAVGV